MTANTKATAMISLDIVFVCSFGASVSSAELFDFHFSIV